MLESASVFVTSCHGTLLSKNFQPPTQGAFFTVRSLLTRGLCTLFERSGHTSFEGG